MGGADNRAVVEGKWQACSYPASWADLGTSTTTMRWSTGRSPVSAS
jgi:hypothetical protein